MSWLNAWQIHKRQIDTKFPADIYCTYSWNTHSKHTHTHTHTHRQCVCVLLAKPQFVCPHVLACIQVRMVTTGSSIKKKKKVINQRCFTPPVFPKVFSRILADSSNSLDEKNIPSTEWSKRILLTCFPKLRLEEKIIRYNDECSAQLVDWQFGG